MPKIKAALANKLKGARKIAILGVGSEFRGDDAAGCVVSCRIRLLLAKRKARTVNPALPRQKYGAIGRKGGVKVFLGWTAPENLTGQIKKFKPSHLVIIDAVDFQGRAGQVKVIDLAKDAGASFSTHRMPFKILRDYLYQSIGCRTIIVGIQPLSVEWGFSLSPKTEEGLEAAAQEILEACGGFA
ncbi:MAG: hydrogenase 3 maturation endopeptidase HyCI [Candidatus Omnitrophica bacterium]|nr:hydrogenase 3 maturation endopeptidase HyCI [Candidatus Omnitrophota bacterium]